MRRTAPAAVLLLAAALSACGGADRARVEADLPRGDPCLDRPADAAMPEECLGGDPAPAASPPAEGSAAYAALVIEPVPGQLAAAGNDADVARTGGQLVVTVPAGGRLGVQAVCEGAARLTVTVEPAGDAFPGGVATDFPCGDGAPRESTVEEPAPGAAPAARTVTVTAPAPSRWYVAVYARP